MVKEQYHGLLFKWFMAYVLGVEPLPYQATAGVVELVDTQDLKS